MPAMADYPNHLARMYLMVTSGTAEENNYYTVVWKFLPNLAMDIIVPLVARFLNVDVATKLLHSENLKARKIALTIATLAGPALLILGYTIWSGTQIGTGKTEWSLLSKPLSILNVWSGANLTLSVFSLCVIVRLLYFCCTF
jgi:hypothetical protein